jgi:hypothetical protein
VPVAVRSFDLRGIAPEAEGRTFYFRTAVMWRFCSPDFFLSEAAHARRSSICCRPTRAILRDPPDDGPNFPV